MNTLLSSDSLVDCCMLTLLLSMGNVLLFCVLTAFWRHLTLATCHQLAQSVLKIHSELAERVGQGGGGWVDKA